MHSVRRQRWLRSACSARSAARASASAAGVRPRSAGGFEAAEWAHERRDGPRVALHDLRGHGVAPAVEHLDVERLVAARRKVRTQQRKPDRTQHVLAAGRCRDPFAFEHRVRHGRARGDPPRVLAPAGHPVTLAQRSSAAEDGDRLHQVRQAPLGRRGVQLAPSNQLVLLALRPQRRASDEVALLAGAYREPRQRIREQRNLAAVGSGSKLVPVQRQPRLQAQRVPCPESDRGRAGLDEPFPQPRRCIAVREQLEADGLPRVAGSRHGERVALEVDDRDAVALVLRQRSGVDQAREHVPGARALERDHREVRALVDQVRTGLGQVPAEPVPVPGTVPGVDDEQEVVTAEPIEIGVVDDSSRLAGDERVLRLERVEPGCVVGEGSQQERFGPRPRHPIAPHVAHVEQTGAAPGREVLGDDPRPVLDRHAPAGEVHHLPAVARVPVVQDGPSQWFTHPTPPASLAHASQRAFPGALRDAG